MPAEKTSNAFSRVAFTTNDLRTGAGEMRVSTVMRSLSLFDRVPEGRELLIPELIQPGPERAEPVGSIA